MKVKKLFAFVFDKEEYSEITSGVEYYKKEFGYFTEEYIKEGVLDFVEEIESFDEEPIVIFTHNVELNKNNEIGYDDYTFYDKTGNVVSEVNRKAINEEILLKREPKYKVGDIVYNLSEGYNKVEKGIISSVPDESTNYYNVLLGSEIHNHDHSLEEFILPISENEVDYLNETLKLRLEKIGY